MNEDLMDKICNVGNELMFIGSLYKENDNYVKYGKNIRSQYDFSDEVAKFLYDNGELMYTTYSQEFTENSINVFMIQDEERKKLYRSYGGWKTISKIIGMSNADDIENYYQVLKKYSLLRELHNKGFDVTKLVEHKNFGLMDAYKISQLMRAKMDKINTIILQDRESEDLMADATSRIFEYIKRPKVGIPTPFPIINSCIKGLLKQRAIGFGIISNAGKSRLIVNMMCYMTLIDDVKVLFLSNEMSKESIQSCLLTTIINSKEIKEKYGWIVSKKTEDDIVLGRYRDNQGEYIEREYDKLGNPLISDDEYKDLLLAKSKELNDILEMTKFVEDKMKHQIFFKDVSENHSDDILEYEIKKHNQLYGVEYFIYDTLKNGKNEEWALLKHTLTNLRTVVKSLDGTLLYDFQLTDDSKDVEPLSLSSMQISSSKHIRHVTDSMFLCKKIPYEDLYLYEWGKTDEEWGDIDYHDFNPEFEYYVFKMDKNRDGNKIDVVMRVDLDTNEWFEMGIPRKKKFEGKSKKR